MLVPESDVAVDIEQQSQCMMEAEEPAKGANTAEKQPSDDAQPSRFTWRIENLSRIRSKLIRSEPFLLGGYRWRLLVYPEGNNTDYLSMYLEVADSHNLPYGWSRYARVSLGVINQIYDKYSIRIEIEQCFNAEHIDWGQRNFMPLRELYNPSGGYFVNDTLIVEAVDPKVIVPTNSKKETGYVGLKNQGATCYMNSLLQTLFHIPYFRKAVYHMPTIRYDMPSSIGIALALQRLFYKLQYSDNSVATTELTKSFGWDTIDSFMQHDVQELNRVLCEKLEEKMKGTIVEGTIQKLFEGHHMNYIECVNVDYKSTRKESFYDIQLDVKGCRDIYDSFDKYVEIECLDGDNKYQSEQHGLQDAKKGLLFIDFPPVLQLHLKRFEYDFKRDTMVKINDRYEFPLQLDLDRDDGKYLSLEADRSVRNLYTLHSVLVHSAGSHGGHYYAFIRPSLSDQWYKFDDEKVTKEDMKEATEEQYGGEEEFQPMNHGLNNSSCKFTKYFNAYMLVYVRESDKDKIMCKVDKTDIAEHLRERLKKEYEEEVHKKQEAAEAHLYTFIKVARDVDLAEQIGQDIYFDLLAQDKLRVFRIPKQMPFNIFKEVIAEEFGIPMQFQRFWLWAKRRNHTYRPDRPLTQLEEAKSVGQLKEASDTVNKLGLNLFLEVEVGADLQPVDPPVKTVEDILLFFKLYDPERKELRYIGRLFVKSTWKPLQILAKLNEMAGYSLDQEIDLYEEIKFKPSIMCDRVDKRASFQDSEIVDGDIICFQKTPAIDDDRQFQYPDVPSFLEYVQNRQFVRFRPIDKPKDDDLCLEMSKVYTYDDVVEKVAEKLGLDDPSKIRLTPHDCHNHQPRLQPIKYRGVDNLSDMLVHNNQISDILYYEVLDIPLPVFQDSKELRIMSHGAMKHGQEQGFAIRLPKETTVGAVLKDLRAEVELSRPDAELRLLEIFRGRILKIFSLDVNIGDIDDRFSTLRAEEILEEERNLGPQSHLVRVCHLMPESKRNFGIPFVFVIHEGETLAEIKERIQKRLEVSDEEFAKWKFAFCLFDRRDYPQDTDILWKCFQLNGPQEYLGLEHPDTTPKRAYAATQNPQPLRKAVKIYN